MLKREIESLRSLLNNLIQSEADYSEIYEVSTQLDVLIVDYCREETGATSR